MTCRASSRLAAKYCVPRGAVGGGATGAGLTAIVVWPGGMMTGRRAKPASNPITSVTRTMMSIFPCVMTVGLPMMKNVFQQKVL